MEYLTDKDFENLKEIQRLLDEGLEHYLTYESHCKSSEGYVSVTISFGNSWERFNGPVKPKIEVTVYSYALGPSRSHYFDDTEMALWAVQGWHEMEMRFNPEDAGEDGVISKALENIFEHKPLDGGKDESIEDFLLDDLNDYNNEYGWKQ